MKGIMYTEPLFHKTVAGEKTQTRRIIPLSCPVNLAPDEWSMHGYWPSNLNIQFVNKKGKSVYVKPRYQPSEVVYLKEPYCIAEWIYYDNRIYDVKIRYPFSDSEPRWHQRLFFEDAPKWTPRGKSENKMFMPAKYARYYIRIESVKVERIADISNPDAAAEGSPFSPVLGDPDPVEQFQDLWDSINCKWKRYKDDFFTFPFERYYNELRSADRRDRHVIPNPWVFAYTYHLCDKEGNILKIAPTASNEGVLLKNE